jgi:hypothetical protein
MNLHDIVSGAIGVVNPPITAMISKNLGYTTSGSGTRTATYAVGVPVEVQRQSLIYEDMVQIEGLNLQGEICSFYIDGNWQGVVRGDGVGGDLITLPSGTTWLVVRLLENWRETDGWVKVCAVRQL